jgi:hypothetical protein
MRTVRMRTLNRNGVEQGGGNSCRLMYAAAFKAQGAAVKPNLKKSR